MIVIFRHLNRSFYLTTSNWNNVTRDSSKHLMHSVLWDLIDNKTTIQLLLRGSRLHLLHMVSALLRPQFGTHSLLTFALVLHHILSVVFLKPTGLIRPSVPPSGSHKRLRFGLWSTLHTLKDFIYLLTYLLINSFKGKSAFDACLFWCTTSMWSLCGIISGHSRSV